MAVKLTPAKVAMPLEAVAVAPLSVPDAAVKQPESVNGAKVTAETKPVTVKLLASWAVTRGWAVKLAPAVAALEGCVVNAR